MRIKILKEAGFSEALTGLSLSYNQPMTNMYNVAKKLAFKDGGHNKFLEFLVVYLDITAPRYWWSQFDTYRIGVSRQSESTMHTLLKRKLTADDFEGRNVDRIVLRIVNGYINDGDLVKAKANLPESFLQRRIVVTNYKSLRNIIDQRKKHKLDEWKIFCKEVLGQCSFRDFLTNEKREDINGYRHTFNRTDKDK